MPQYCLRLQHNPTIAAGAVSPKPVALCHPRSDRVPLLHVCVLGGATTAAAAAVEAGVAAAAMSAVSPIGVAGGEEAGSGNDPPGMSYIQTGCQCARPMQPLMSCVPLDVSVSSRALAQERAASASNDVTQPLTTAPPSRLHYRCCQVWHHGTAAVKIQGPLFNSQTWHFAKQICPRGCLWSAAQTAAARCLPYTSSPLPSPTPHLPLSLC